MGGWATSVTQKKEESVESLMVFNIDTTIREPKVYWPLYSSAVSGVATHRLPQVLYRDNVFYLVVSLYELPKASKRSKAFLSAAPVHANKCHSIMLLVLKQKSLGYLTTDGTAAMSKVVQNCFDCYVEVAVETGKEDLSQSPPTLVLTLKSGARDALTAMPEKERPPLRKRARRAGPAASTSASVEAATGSSEAVPASGAPVSKSLSISPTTGLSDAADMHWFDAQSFRSRGQTDEGKKKLRLAFTTMCGIYDTVHGAALVCKDSGEVVQELGKHNFSRLVARYPSYCENRYAKDISGSTKPGTFSQTVYHELNYVQKSLRKGETKHLFSLFKDICKLGDELIG
jgi:hypothetical protein